PAVPPACTWLQPAATKPGGSVNGCWNGMRASRSGRCTPPRWSEPTRPPRPAPRLWGSRCRSSRACWSARWGSGPVAASASSRPCRSGERCSPRPRPSASPAGRASSRCRTAWSPPWTGCVPHTPAAPSCASPTPTRSAACSPTPSADRWTRCSACRSPVLRLRRSLPGRGEPGGAADQLQQPVSGRADGPVTADPEKGSLPDPRHGPSSTEHFDQAALSRLAEEEIELIGGIVGSSNETFLVRLGDSSALTHAVYKPELGERPLGDFPPGLHRRERAAYLISRHLGWDLVPPTVLRTDGPFGEGSLQLFIHHDP